MTLWGTCSDAVAMRWTTKVPTIYRVLKICEFLSQTMHKQGVNISFMKFYLLSWNCVYCPFVKILVLLTNKCTMYGINTFLLLITLLRGPGSSVGIATGYGLDGPGWNRGGARFSTPVQTGPGAHPASCTMGTGSFPGVKSGRGVMPTPHSLLVPWSRKGRAIPLLPL
jgi:hypothetical protein